MGVATAGDVTAGDVTAGVATAGEATTTSGALVTSGSRGNSMMEFGCSSIDVLRMAADGGAAAHTGHWLVAWLKKDKLSEMARIAGCRRGSLNIDSTMPI